MRLPDGSARRKRMVKRIAVALGFRPSWSRAVPGVLGLNQTGFTGDGLVPILRRE